MHIASSTAGLYPVLVPAVRKPVVAVNGNDVVSTGDSRDVSGNAARASAAIDQALRQRTEEPKREILPAADFVQVRPDVEGSNVGGATRQFNSIFSRVSIESFSEKPAEGSIQSAAQRAVTAYTDVATQEHRDELVQLLGIDVFA